MPECITRKMIDDSDVALATDRSSDFAWLERTRIISEEIFPDDTLSNRFTSRDAMYAMDMLLENTLKDSPLSLNGFGQIPESLDNDQIEDWVCGQGVIFALDAERSWSIDTAKLKEDSHG